MRHFAFLFALLIFGFSTIQAQKASSTVELKNKISSLVGTLDSLNKGMLPKTILERIGGSGDVDLGLHSDEVERFEGFDEAVLSKVVVAQCIVVTVQDYIILAYKIGENPNNKVMEFYDFVIEGVYRDFFNKNWNKECLIGALVLLKKQVKLWCLSLWSDLRS